MQTRNSIKAVFVIVSILCCLIMARTFFVMMFEYYKEGTKTTVSTFLRDAVKMTSEENLYAGGIHVHSEWSRFPDSFREVIAAPPTPENPMVKNSKETPILWSPEKIYYVLLTENREGTPVYVGKRLDWSPTGVMIGDFNLLIYWRAFALSILFAVFVTALLLFVLKFLVTPLESLKVWAQTISETSSGKSSAEQIKFRFREFADIAEVIATNIERQKESIRKEQEFLQFSSHELRSPLAVLRSNVDLLKRLGTQRPEKEHRVLARIDGATTTMSGLVETFLWLNRNEERSISPEHFDLAALTAEVTSEAQYLLAGKSVEVVMNTSPLQVTLPLMPCRIVLSNIICNAFKHASSGGILIHNTGCRVKIANENPTIQAHESNNTGFGLGLRLVEKIAAGYHWQVDVCRSGGLYVVEIDFSDQRPDNDGKRFSLAVS